MKRTTALRKGFRLAEAAGWIAIGMGVVHVLVSPLERRDVWSQVIADGVWNTFTLEPANAGEHERSEVFWTTLGSWAVPTLALGCHVVWSARRRQRVPGWLGWILLVWGTPLVIVLPASPGWAFPLMGGLIILGDRRHGRSIAERAPAVVSAEAVGAVQSKGALRAARMSAGKKR